MESIEHAKLVQFLDSEVTRLFDVSRLFKFTDSQNGIGEKLPPKVGEHIPDLVYQDIDGKFIVIGEAKTQNDIDNPHTYSQIRSYCNQLHIQGKGTLIFAVPPMSERRMQHAIRAFCVYEGVKIFVISYAKKLESTE